MRPTAYKVCACDSVPDITPSLQRFLLSIYYSQRLIYYNRRCKREKVFQDLTAAGRHPGALGGKPYGSLCGDSPEITA